MVRDLATLRVALGRLRHELEHARQHQRSPETYEFMGVAQDVLRHAIDEKGVDCLCGSALLYNALPHEMDANRAAARLTSSHFGGPSETELAGSGAELFRDDSPVEFATLSRRLLALTALFPDSLVKVAERRGATGDELIESLDFNASAAWVKLSSDPTVTQWGEEVLNACPSKALIEAAQPASDAWLPARDNFLSGLDYALSRLNESGPGAG